MGRARGGMQVDLAGKVALVTGGTRGLGWEIANGLAECGADVVVASRHQEACDEAAQAISASTGRRTFGQACHVGDWDQVDALVAASYERFGRVDVLVNNAGISPTYRNLSDVSRELFDKTISVNLAGPFRLSVLVGDRMAEAGSGSIVNVSSTGAVRPRPHHVPYSAAKAGLNAMTVGLAHAFGPQVRVNAVMAGPFRTDVTQGWDWERMQRRFDRYALSRVGEPDEVVGSVLYFASEASSYTTGAVLAVDGGEP